MTSTSDQSVDKALADLADGKYRTARAAAFAHNAPLSTMYARRKGRPPRSNIDLISQRMTKKEEQALVVWIEDLQRSYQCPNSSKVEEFVLHLLRKKGHVTPLGQHWLRRLRSRWPEIAIKRSRITDISRLLALTPEAITMFYDAISSIQERYSVGWDKIYNMDEKGFQLGQIGKQLVWYNKQQGAPIAPSTGRTQWVSIIECYPATGLALAPFVIHQGQQVYDRYFETTEPADLYQGWSWGFSNKGWSDNELGVRWLSQHFLPATWVEGEHSILILDGHESHISGEFQYEAYTHDVHLVYLPPHSSHLLQPLDLGPFGPIQTAYSRGVQDTAPTGLTPLRRQEFNVIYQQARQEAFKSQHRRAGWTRTGIYPYRPDRVLQSEQVVNMTRSRPNITPPPLSEGIYTTPTTIEQVQEVVDRIEDTCSPTTARHAMKLGHAAIASMTTASLLQDALGELRKRKIDDSISKRGKQLKKDEDQRVWTFEQVKAAREGKTPPPARTTARQRQRGSAAARAVPAEPQHQVSSQNTT